MPPKAKKKRAVAKFSVEAKVPETDASEPVRQVVEVVEEEPKVEEALETIKEDVKEIEDAVETIEQEVQEESPKDVVGSLFTKQDASIGPEITVVGKRDTTLGIWVGAMLGIALAVGVSLVVLVRGPQTFTSIIKKPTPTSTVTIAPTQAPAATIERKDVHVKVLNGGGTPGAGSKMKAFLEEKGYVVDAVGNTPEYSYETTDIVLKAGKDAIGKMLSEDLKADYSLGSTSATLDSDATYDAEVIVGKE